MIFMPIDIFKKVSVEDPGKDRVVEAIVGMGALLGNQLKNVKTEVKDGSKSVKGEISSSSTKATAQLNQSFVKLQAGFNKPLLKIETSISRLASHVNVIGSLVKDATKQLRIQEANAKTIQKSLPGGKINTMLQALRNAEKASKASGVALGKILTGQHRFEQVGGLGARQQELLNRKLTQAMIKNIPTWDKMTGEADIWIKKMHEMVRETSSPGGKGKFPPGKDIGGINLEAMKKRWIEFQKWRSNPSQRFRGSLTGRGLTAVEESFGKRKVGAEGKVGALGVGAKAGRNKAAIAAIIAGIAGTAGVAASFSKLDELKTAMPKPPAKSTAINKDALDRIAAISGKTAQDRPPEGPLKQFLTGETGGVNLDTIKQGLDAIKKKLIDPVVDLITGKHNVGVQQRKATDAFLKKHGLPGRGSELNLPGKPLFPTLDKAGFPSMKVNKRNIAGAILASPTTSAPLESVRIIQEFLQSTIGGAGRGAGLGGGGRRAFPGSQTKISSMVKNLDKIKETSAKHTQIAKTGFSKLAKVAGAGTILALTFGRFKQLAQAAVEGAMTSPGVTRNLIAPRGVSDTSAYQFVGGATAGILPLMFQGNQAAGDALMQILKDLKPAMGGAAAGGLANRFLTGFKGEPGRMSEFLQAARTGGTSQAVQQFAGQENLQVAAQIVNAIELANQSNPVIDAMAALNQTMEAIGMVVDKIIIQLGRLVNHFIKPDDPARRKQDDLFAMPFVKLGEMVGLLEEGTVKSMKFDLQQRFEENTAAGKKTASTFSMLTQFEDKRTKKLKEEQDALDAVNKSISERFNRLKQEAVGGETLRVRGGIQGSLLEIMKLQTQVAATSPFGNLATIDHLKEQNRLARQQYDTLKLIQDNTDVETAGGRKEFLGLEKELLGLQLLQKTNTKALRDIYTDGIISDAFGAGAFEKIIVSQERNLAKGLEKVMVKVPEQISGSIGLTKGFHPMDPRKFMGGAGSIFDTIEDRKRNRRNSRPKGRDGSGGVSQLRAAAASLSTAAKLIEEELGDLPAFADTGFDAGSDQD